MRSQVAAKYRFTDEELVENIRLFEAIVTSTRNDGATAEALIGSHMNRGRDK